MKKTGKRIISMAVVICLLATLFIPLNAFAAIDGLSTTASTVKSSGDMSSEK